MHVSFRMKEDFYRLEIISIYVYINLFYIKIFLNIDVEYFSFRVL
jgi:hypothetical protein